MCVLRWQCWSFVQATEVVAVAPHVIENAGRGIRKGKSGDACVIENIDPSGNFASSHPAGQNWLSGRVGVRFQSLGSLRRLRHALRTRDGEEAINIWITRGNFQGLGITFRQGVTQDVDGIVVAPVW